MIDDVLREAAERMNGATGALENDMAAIRTGRASPALVERLTVIYYDQPTPLIELATIAAPEPQLISIRPYDPTSLVAIEKAIQASDLGLTPSNDGKLIRLPIPPMTEERRKEVVKMVHSRVEEAKVAVRNVRRDAQEDLRELEKEKIIGEDDFHRGRDDLQKLTDKIVERIEEIGAQKEREVTEV